MTTQEWRRRLRQAHLCMDCKQQDAYTLGGRSRCAECAAKNAARQRERRRENPEAHRASVAENRQRRKQRGLCEYCGKYKPKDGHVVCGIRLAKQSQRHHDKLIADGVNWPRGANGYCWQCNKRKAVEGKRMCQPCIDEKMKYLTPEERARVIGENQRIKDIERNGITLEHMMQAEKDAYARGITDGQNATFETCFAAVCLSLHEMHGFGAKRCMDVLNDVYNKMMTALNSADAIQQVYDEMGLEIKFNAEPTEDFVQEVGA